MGKVFLTSDTFFGRNLEAVNRGFSDTEEMEEILIDNWNDRVNPEDTVYHLGNFAWDPISAESALAFLNGKIYFIGGEYDKHMSDISLIKLGVHHLLPSISYLPKLDLVLSHWPMLDWNSKCDGAIHAHGGKIPTDLNEGYRFNVNLSNWNLAPIELDFLKELTQIK
jgi:calcineurin-like phosphoesterase family protein